MPVIWSTRILGPMLLTLGLGLGLLSYGERQWPRLWLFDLYQRISPAHHDAAAITIIDIDSESVRRLGRWPWPRDRLAGIIDQARGALVVGLDILLLEPDRTSPGDPDAALAGAMARTQVVLAAARDEAARAEVISVIPTVQSGGDAQPFLPLVSQVAWPLPIFQRGSSGTGLALLLPERDGVVRRLPTLFADGATLLPSFALEVLRVAMGERLLRIRTDTLGVQSVSVGQRTMRTDMNGAIWPHFTRALPARIIAAHSVLAGEVDPALLTGRIVLVGSSLAGLGDVHLTPLGETETGTAINAQLISSILTGDTLWRPAGANAGEAVVLVFFGFGSLLLFRRISWRMQFALVGAVLVALALSSFVAFSTYGMLLDWTSPVAGTAVINLTLGVIQLRADRRARRQAETRLAAALDEIERARSVVTQALHSSKLATLGELSAVLAHELRQPIATMSMAAENAEAALQEGNLDVDDARVRIDRIIMQAKRAESIIEQLGIFARSDPGALVPVDLETAVKDALRLIEPSLRRQGIEITVECEIGLPPVRAVKVLIEQVVINLCLNARDALAEMASAERAIRVSLGSEGPRVRLAIADTGPGLSGEIMAQVFEPFFTTKPAGTGTGLGLSVCRRIVESFGGSITTRNGLEGGAVFIATFPAIDASGPEISQGT